MLQDLQSPLEHPRQRLETCGIFRVSRGLIREGLKWSNASSSIDCSEHTNSSQALFNDHVERKRLTFQ